MNKSLILAALVAALFASGCNKKEEAPVATQPAAVAPAAQPAQPVQPPQPAAATSAPAPAPEVKSEDSTTKPASSKDQVYTGTGSRRNHFR